MEHPTGVQPTSLMALHGGDDRVRQRGLGLLASLPDECVLGVVQLLPARALGVLSAVSQALYAFAQHDEIWKGLVLEVSSALWGACNAWRGAMHCAGGSRVPA